MNDVELRYVTKGELDCDQAQKMLETAKPFWPKERIIKLSVVFGVSFALVVCGDLMLNTWKHVAFLALFAVVYAVVIWRVTKRVRKNRRQAFFEQYHDGKLAYENGFADDGVHVHNLSNGAHGILAYDVISKLVVAKGMWILVSKASACVPVFCEQLSETDRKSVLGLLKSNNPEIKIDLPKKK